MLVNSGTIITVSTIKSKCIVVHLPRKQPVLLMLTFLRSSLIHPNNSVCPLHLPMTTPPNHLTRSNWALVMILLLPCQQLPVAASSNVKLAHTLHQLCIDLPHPTAF